MESTNTEAPNTKDRNLSFDKTTANVAVSLGIAPERIAEIDKEYDAAISTVLDEVIQPKMLEGGFGIQFSSADLYAAVAQIPHTPAEAFYVGQTVGRAAEKLHTTVNKLQSKTSAMRQAMENVLGGMSNRPGFGRSNDTLMDMLSGLMGKKPASKEDNCPCPACVMRRSLSQP